MKRRTVTIAAWCCLALATAILLATDPGPRAILLVALSWTGGLVSYRLAAGARTTHA